MRNDGASTVVAATLILALSVLMFIVFSSTQLPNWIEDREQNHALGVKEEMASLQSKLLQVTDDDIGRTISSEISLAPDPIAFLQRGKASGQLSILDTTAIDLQLSNEVLVANGAALASNPDGALSAWADVAIVHSLALQINVNTAAADATGVVVTFDDGTTSVDASFLHIGPAANSPCTGYALVATLSLPARNIPQTCGVSGTGSFTIDLFDVLPLREALGNLERPFTVSFSVNSTSATGGAVWYNSAGLPQLVGSGIAGSYDLQTTLGTVAYLPSYLNAIREDVMLEGGALSVAQASGAAMISPTVRLVSDGTSTLLELSFIDFTGSGSVSGDGTAGIHVTPTAISNSLYQVQDVTLQVTGSVAWGNHFEDELYLSQTAGSFVTGATSELQVDTLTNSWVRVRVIEARVELK